MPIDVSRKTSPVLSNTIIQLNELSRKNQSTFWRDIAEKLSAGRRRYASVDLGKIERLCNEGDTVVVPGAVLGGGNLQKKITVSALKFSSSAVDKIANVGGKHTSLVQLAEENPKGTNIKIIR
ncbi:MAG: 50S ribosomal protein L18e [Candidatus Thermoplasmatota archaeon]|jgi:large subunit ribosomal protein L18e|nr:50S ribosomal protein L18e [Candidatus Thermoplasmatota archaeon]MCL5800289.1 50S ribosomal protein L18e [Candidatus Thermoplasmatota archaeon]